MQRKFLKILTGQIAKEDQNSLIWIELKEGSFFFYWSMVDIQYYMLQVYSLAIHNF